MIVRSDLSHGRRINQLKSISVRRQKEQKKSYDFFQNSLYSLFPEQFTVHGTKCSSLSLTPFILCFSFFSLEWLTKHLNKSSAEMISDLIPSLPNDIALVVLVGVPCQFHSVPKSVCKSWNSLLSDPSFYTLCKANSLVRVKSLSSWPGHRCPAAV